MGKGEGSSETTELGYNIHGTPGLSRWGQELQAKKDRVSNIPRNYI